MLKVLNLGTRMKLDSELQSDWNLWEGEGGWLRALRSRNFRKGKQHSNFSKIFWLPWRNYWKLPKMLKCVDLGLGCHSFGVV